MLVLICSISLTISFIFEGFSTAFGHSGVQVDVSSGLMNDSASHVGIWVTLYTHLLCTGGSRFVWGDIASRPVIRFRPRLGASLPGDGTVMRVELSGCVDRFRLEVGTPYFFPCRRLLGNSSRESVSIDHFMVRFDCSPLRSATDCNCE